MKMPRCVNCGRRLYPRIISFRFILLLSAPSNCPKCGKKLSEEKKKQVKNYYYLVFVVIIIIIIIVFISFFTIINSIL